MKVLAFGETTYDIIFKDKKPIDGRVGGSILNTVVSLGRLGVPVSMAALCGSDEIGKITVDFLNDNNIDTTFLTVYEGTSRIALAFLDAENNASYSFYNGRRPDDKQLVFPPGDESGLVIFGSLFGIQADIRPEFVKYLKQIRQAGNIIYYDPNVRPSQLAVNPYAKDWILENISLSHIVKGSREDFNLVFNTQSSQEAYNALKVINPNVVLVVTADKHGADLFTPSIYKHIDAPSIIPVSTIGAGDTFSAGLIYGLFESNVTLNNLLYLSEDNWSKYLHYAIQFATEVCLSYDNYIVRDSSINFNNSKK